MEYILGDAYDMWTHSSFLSFRVSRGSMHLNNRCSDVPYHPSHSTFLFFFRWIKSLSLLEDYWYLFIMLSFEIVPAIELWFNPLNIRKCTRSIHDYFLYYTGRSSWANSGDLSNASIIGRCSQCSIFSIENFFSILTTSFKMIVDHLVMFNEVYHAVRRTWLFKWNIVQHHQYY